MFSDTYTEINKLHPYDYKDGIYMHKLYHTNAHLNINSCACPSSYLLDDILLNH